MTTAKTTQPKRIKRYLVPPVVYFKRSWKIIAVTAIITWGTHQGMEFLTAPWRGDNNSTPKTSEQAVYNENTSTSASIRCPNCGSLLLINTPQPSVHRVGANAQKITATNCITAHTLLKKEKVRAE